MLESNSCENMGFGDCKSVFPSLCRGHVLTLTPGYWAFLDFALAFVPVDIVWKLQMRKSKKFLLSLLLSMGVL